MILRSLALENFRSYGQSPTRIEFERGVTLFEGDIGSGKSSILYAIEFALFGLGDIEARHVLRSSAPSSKVELDFEVENQEYKVVRTIERKKGSKTLVTSGWISEKGGNLTSYAPTELRSKILKILSFKEKPSAKSSSRIFRFAVFTPQELMREVLSQKPDDRIETLRRAFGIEDYSIASSNAEVVSKSLKTKSEIDSTLAKALPEKESNLEKLNKSLLNDRSRLEAAKKQISSLEEQIKEKERDLAELEAARDSAKSLETILPQLERALSDSKIQLSSTKSRIELQKKDLTEIQRAKSLAASLKEDYTLYTQSKEKLRSLEYLPGEQLKLVSKISDLQSRINSKESSLRAELRSRNDDLKRCESTIVSFENELKDLGQLKEKFSALEQKIEEREPLLKSIEEAKSEISSLRTMVASKRSEIAELNAKDLKDLSVCPLCGQELDPSHLEKVSSERKEKLDSLNAEIHASQRAQRELEATLGDLQSKRLVLDSVQKDYDSLGKRLAALHQSSIHLEKQSAEFNDIKSKISNLETSLESRDYSRAEEAELSTLLKKREEMSGPLKEYNDLRSRLQKLDEVERKYLAAVGKAQRENDVHSLIRAEEGSLEKLEESIHERNKEISEKRAELESLEPMIFHYSKTKDAINEMRLERDNLRSTFDTLTSALTIYSKNIEELEKQVFELKKNQESAARSKSLSSWLDLTFLPTISEIETYVLDSLNEEFERMFERWFGILIEDGDIEVKLDERFTPLIVQSGYDLDIESLSGGERTAVALAYRLALNFMVRKASEALSTNLLILDEPTEGFSKEQVYRLRNVFEELDSDQIILVSHERDLETMADRVYRVEKSGSESRLDLAK